MWRNPSYPAPEQPQPPAETGERVATFPRGENAELRVCIDAYQGHEFLSLRVWEVGQSGGWFPTKKGCTVRLSEAQPLALVLAETARRVMQASNRGRALANSPEAGGQYRNRKPAELDRPGAMQPGFDEIGE